METEISTLSAHVRKVRVNPADSVVTPGDPAPAARSGGTLRADALGVRDLVFFVLSAAAPLTVMVGFAALAFMFGGVIAPMGYLIAGIVFAVFAVGFTAMSRHMRNSGAFYAYIRR